MEPLSDMLQGELERLFELDAMIEIGTQLLGLDPNEVGSTASKGAFARALVARCDRDHALAALADAIVLSSPQADARLREIGRSPLNGELKPGTTIDGLRVIKKLSEGSLQVVYLAEAAGETGKRVVLRVVRHEYAQDKAATQRFVTVSRALKSLQSQGLAPVVGVGVLSDERPWVAAEWVEGQTLAARVERTGCLHFNEARLIFNDILEALKALHARGVVHGDVSTDNVFIIRKATASSSGSESHGVLVGGGTDRLLARRHGGATGVLPLLASAKSTSPEQARGLEVDARSDIYAMGVLMYEVLAGRPPFTGDSVIEVVAQHLSAAPEPPSSHAKRGWVPKELDDVVMRALEKEPASRFQSVQGLLDALSRMGRASLRPQQIDMAAFRDAVAALLQNPQDAALATSLEEMADGAGAWKEAAEALTQVIGAASDVDTQLGLLFRLARIYEGELKDGLRAEATYERIIELDPDDEVARSGIETARRERGDGEGLIEVLLEKIERLNSSSARADTLSEIAQVYERQLNDSGNALVAWLQALTEEPGDERALREVERLAAGSEERWGEAVTALADAAQAIQALLTESPEPESAPVEQPGAAEQAQLEIAQQARDFHRQNLTMAELHWEEASAQLDALERAAEEKATATATAHAEAEAVVARYEATQGALEQSPDDDDLQITAAQLAEEAEALVDAASTAEEESNALTAQLETLRASVSEIEARVTEAQAAANVAEQAVDAAQANLSLAQGAELLPPEPMGDDDIAAQADNLVRLYVIMGRWYAENLSRPDFAMSCFSQALNIDPGNESAYDATTDLYRMAQAWGDLAGLLLQRAERTQSPVKARDYRAEAALVIAERLGDANSARAQFEAILHDDPGHPVAQQHLEQILVAQEDWAGVAAIWERRVESTPTAERAALLNRLGELYEDRLDNLERAITAFRGTLQVEPRDLTALKGLERIYARSGEYQALMDNLRVQVDLAATPKQRIGLLVRIGALQDEEFLDVPGAIETYENIVALDSSQDSANLALARLYRQAGRFSDVVTTLERHAASAADDERKTDLLLTAVRTLMVELGAPDRAMELCERILRIDENHSEALDQLAKLKSTAGDVSAAVQAVERLADAEQDSTKRAELYIRAATLLEDRGDSDGAIEHYKTALDHDRLAETAINGLSRIYSKRGDAHGAIEMLGRHIDIAEGDNKRAELFAEIGRLSLERLRDHTRAREALEKALELDPTCIAASIGLGQMEFESEKYQLATEHFESPLDHLEQMPQAQALRLCQLAGEAYRHLKDYDNARKCFERARTLDSGNLKAHEQVANLLLDAGDAKGAERLYFDVVRQFADKVDEAERGRLLMLHGRSQLAAGSAKKAVETIKLALGLRPQDREVLAALTEANIGAREWSEAISLLQLRTRGVASEQEKFDLLVQIGDIFLEKVRDREAASQTYVSALEIRPDDRNLLTKLMAVYSDGKDWARLIEVILRIAEMVSDAGQLAKYYNTAATIAFGELGRNDEAANYYEEALSHDAGMNAAFTGLVQCLTQNQDWERLERAYETRADRVRQTASREEVARLLDARGEVLQFRLNRVGDAIRVYEAAQEVDPENRARREMLTDIYTKEPKRFFQRAVQSHRELLAQNPFRIESYQALRKIYTSAKKPDESWCVCQALRVLNMADPEEEKFFAKYRLTKLAKAKQPISDELWRDHVVHPEQNAALTQILATMMPAVIATQAQTLRSLGIDERNRANPATDPTAIGRMLEYVADASGLRLPPVYHRTQDQGGVSFLFVSPPAIGIGQAAAAGGPQQALAFVAGRHLSYYRGGHFMRRLVPTGTGLRAWLMAAIRSVNPKFPVPASMEPAIKEALAAINTHLSGPQRDGLRSMTQKLLEAAPELDLKRWVAGVDYTADRVGFILSNDLKVSQAVIEASPEDSAAVSKKERAQELLRYSVSESYFELRHRLGIALGG